MAKPSSAICRVGPDVVLGREVSSSCSLRSFFGEDLSMIRGRLRDFGRHPLNASSPFTSLLALLLLAMVVVHWWRCTKSVPTTPTAS